MTDIKELALRVAKESKLRDILWIDERIETYCDEVVSVTDFAQRFLAAYLAEQEPDGWIDGEGDPYSQHGWGKKPPPGWTNCEEYSYPVFRAPPLPDTAPQEGTTRPAAPPARETPIDAAQLPEEVQRMSEWLRGDCWHDAARLLERMAGEIEQLHGALDAKIDICGDQIITALREQVAALTKERDELLADHWVQGEEYAALSAKLAASNIDLTASLDTVGHAENARNILVNAISIPTDDTALRERLKEERERCAQRVESIGKDIVCPEECAAAIRSMA